MGGLSAAFLNAGPLVPQPHRAVEQQRGVVVGGEVSEPLELHYLSRGGVSQRGFHLRVGEQLAGCDPYILNLE